MKTSRELWCYVFSPRLVVTWPVSQALNPCTQPHSFVNAMLLICSLTILRQSCQLWPSIDHAVFDVATETLNQDTCSHSQLQWHINWAKQQICRLLVVSLCMSCIIPFVLNYYLLLSKSRLNKKKNACVIVSWKSNTYSGALFFLVP